MLSYLYIVPSGPVQNVQLKVVNSTSIQVSWEDPSYRHINSHFGITFYKVVISDDYECGTENYSWTVSSQRLIVNSLEPGNTYCVRVYAGNNFGLANSSVSMESDQRIELPNVPGTYM